jgi:ATP-dependent RNA helicase RhlE
MNDFKEGKLRILVSTDVASRGIDVTNVSHVINFDVPIVYEDYVHRTGRTGRAFQEGTAITLVTETEKYHIDKIEKIIREKIPVKKMPAEVEVSETTYREADDMAREIDRQKRYQDPEFKGAFHEKKRKKRD